MARFGTAARLAAWSGVALGNNESVGKQRSGKTRKGNQALRTGLTPLAHALEQRRELVLVFAQGDDGIFHLAEYLLRLGVKLKDVPLVIASRRICLRLAMNIRTVQELLGHKDVRTTMIYAHVLNQGGKGVRSPLDTI